jgi:hypothetical protein
MPYLQHHNASQSAIAAWMCAAKCGFEACYPIGQSAYAPMFFLARVISGHKLQMKDWTPADETALIQQQQHHLQQQQLQQQQQQLQQQQQQQHAHQQQLQMQAQQPPAAAAAQAPPAMASQSEPMAQ